jgi:hypothetical protein
MGFRPDSGPASGASSSMVEQRAFNPLVQGSSPWGRTLVLSHDLLGSCFFDEGQAER